MSQSESDGIDEALQGVTHVALTAAGRLGEQMARMREQQVRAEQARSQQAGQEYAARMTAEREAARASLAVVHRPEWWDSAPAEDVTKAYQTATAWRDLDPEAVRAEQRIVAEVRARYGVDVAAGDPAAVTAAIQEQERAGAAAAEERTAGHGEEAEAVSLMLRADAMDRAAEQAVQTPTDGDPASQVDVDEQKRTGRDGDELREPGGHAYDSAERREEMAEGLDHVENRAAVEARVRSDVAQGRPASEATVGTPGRAPTARKTRAGQATGRRAARPSRGR